MPVSSGPPRRSLAGWLLRRSRKLQRNRPSKTPGPLTELGGASQASPNARSILGCPTKAGQWIGGKSWRIVLPAVARGHSRVAGYLNSYCMAWVSERVVSDLRVDVLEKLSTLSWISSIARGRAICSRASTRTRRHCKGCLSLGFADSIKEPFTVLGILAGLLLIDWQLTLIAMIFFPACVVPIILLGRKCARPARERQRLGFASQFLRKCWPGFASSKPSGWKKEQVARFRKWSRDLVHHGRVHARQGVINPIIETISMIGLGLLVVHYRLSPAHGRGDGCFLTGLALIYTPIRSFAALHVLFEQTSIGIERLLQIFRRADRAGSRCTRNQGVPIWPQLPMSASPTVTAPFSNKSISPSRAESSWAWPRQSGSGKSTWSN